MYQEMLQVGSGGSGESVIIEEIISDAISLGPHGTGTYNITPSKGKIIGIKSINMMPLGTRLSIDSWHIDDENNNLVVNFKNTSSGSTQSGYINATIIIVQ